MLYTTLSANITFHGSSSCNAELPKREIQTVPFILDGEKSVDATNMRLFDASSDVNFQTFSDVVVG